MSTYQYYDFAAIDKPLTAAEQTALREVSTRATITANRFVNTYDWGDLKADPRQMVEKYFDAFLYTANWGTRQLIFRFPRKLISLETAQQYCYFDDVEAWTKGSHTLVSLTYSAENFDDDAEWEDLYEGQGQLSIMAPVRSEVMEGDLRLLYLGWLLAADSGLLDDDELEPPAPASLAHLSDPLQTVAEFLNLDPYLIAAAAENSTALPDATDSDRTAGDLLMRAAQLRGQAG